VRMRARLLGFVRTGLARQRQELMLILQRAVGRDGQNRNAAATVIRHDQKLAAGIDRLAYAVLASGRGAIEQFGLSCRAVERERRSVFAVAVYLIEKPLIWDQLERR